MSEPKIDQKEEKLDNKIEKPQDEKNQAAAQDYWNYVQNTKMLSVADLAAYVIDEGLVVVPVDNIGRPVLDSTLFFTAKALLKLAEAMDNIIKKEEE